MERERRGSEEWQTRNRRRLGVGDEEAATFKAAKLGFDASSIVDRMGRRRISMQKILSKER